MLFGIFSDFHYHYNIIPKHMTLSSVTVLQLWFLCYALYSTVLVIVCSTITAFHFLA